MALYTLSHMRAVARKGLIVSKTMVPEYSIYLLLGCLNRDKLSYKELNEDVSLPGGDTGPKSYFFGWDMHSHLT